MLISFNKLKKLPVQTESGAGLGAVADLLIDTDARQISKFQVEKKKLIQSAEQYLIAPEQITSITDERIIVADNVAEQEAREQEKPLVALESAGVLQSERD